MMDKIVNFLMVGLCGGFTTFSTFSMQNVRMLQEGWIGSALNDMRSRGMVGLQTGGVPPWQKVLVDVRFGRHWFLYCGHFCQQYGHFVYNRSCGIQLLLVHLGLFEQEKRVEKGWFPSNPKRKR